MLRERQAGRLLRRLETHFGEPLLAIASRLRTTDGRAGAIWELLILDALIACGDVLPEPGPGMPDARVTLPSGTVVWIEAAFVHSQEESVDRQKNVLQGWLNEALRKADVEPTAVSYAYRAHEETRSGPRPHLPGEHQKREFLHSEGVVKFLTAIRTRPDSVVTQALDPWSVTVNYCLRNAGEFQRSSSPVFDQPQTVESHSLYKAVQSKRKQHDVAAPYVIWVGTDSNHAIRTQLDNRFTPETVLARALSGSVGVAAVMVTVIEDRGLELARRPRTTLFRTASAAHPLSDADAVALLHVDLAKWSFGHHIPRFFAGPVTGVQGTGPLVLRSGKGAAVKLLISASVLVDVLAGKSPLADLYRPTNGSVSSALQDGWEIVDIRLLSADIERGHDPQVEITLAPSTHDVYWPKSDRL